jgi:hypothetical protein
MTDKEQDYFEKMLDARFGHLTTKVEEVISLQKIANGRTTKNENSIHDLNEWRAESRGHWKAASVIGSAIGALLGLALTAWLKG